MLSWMQSQFRWATMILCESFDLRDTFILWETAYHDLESSCLRAQTFIWAMEKSTASIAVNKCLCDAIRTGHWVSCIYSNSLVKLNTSYWGTCCRALINLSAVTSRLVILSALVGIILTWLAFTQYCVGGSFFGGCRLCPSYLMLENELLWYPNLHRFLSWPSWLPLYYFQ